MITITAPAKVNLTLEVLGKRPDGFHEIRSVIQAVSLCDTLSLRPSDTVEFRCDLPDWIAERSLVSRAANLLQEATGCHKGATVEINKCIPLLSGLGGDSSDAAATLRGLNQLWGLGLSKSELVELAWQLGSDVACFLYEGTALVEGRGEIVTPLPSLPHWWVLLVLPAIPRLPGKTKQLYRSLSANHYTDGRITHRLVEELREGRDFTSSLLFNTFENVAFTFFSGLDAARRQMLKIGAADVHLAGSGPALFTLIDDRTDAEQLYLRLQDENLPAYLGETLPRLDATV